MAGTAQTPLLRYIPILHDDEKARRAPALKGIAHVRRAPAPAADAALRLRPDYAWLAEIFARHRATEPPRSAVSR